MLSHSGESALKAVLELARGEPDEWSGVRLLARRLGGSPTYLAKIMQTLAREGVLESQRGASGGFRLARPATEIRLLEVVAPFDDLTAGRRCLLGRSSCSDRAPCAVHHRWKQVAERMAEFFSETTVGELLDGEQVPGPAELSRGRTGRKLPRT
jgi:Rrf2 family transcriptional regulator, iron-sulfur cluster assembly transcription factor